MAGGVARLIFPRIRKGAALADTGGKGGSGGIGFRHAAVLLHDRTGTLYRLRKKVSGGGKGCGGYGFRTVS